MLEKEMVTVRAQIKFNNDDLVKNLERTTKRLTNQQSTFAAKFEEFNQFIEKRLESDSDTIRIVSRDLGSLQALVNMANGPGGVLG